MNKAKELVSPSVNRRSFLKTGMLAGGAATVGAALAGGPKNAYGQSSSLTEGEYCHPALSGRSRTHRSRSLERVCGTRWTHLWTTH